MRTERLPRRDSHPYRALEILAKHGGLATATAWFDLAGTTSTAYQFQVRAINPLLKANLISYGLAYEITPVGRAWLGQEPVTKSEAPQQIVQPRQQAPFRELNRSRSAQVYRPGAFDYRNYPSRVGDVFIPFGQTTQA